MRSSFLRPLALGFAALLGLCACSKLTEHDQISALRVSPETPKTYRYEAGIFSKDGFTAASSQSFPYDMGQFSQADVLALAGRPVVHLATWNMIKSNTPFHANREYTATNAVHYVFLSN